MVSVTIAGASVTPADRTIRVLRNLRITDRVGERSICRLRVVDKTGALAITDGQTISVTEGADTLFAGVVHRPVRSRPGGDGLYAWDLECIDWHCLCDRRLAARSYDDIAAGAVVLDLITRYLGAEGITAGTIEDGPTVAAVVFNYAPVSRCLDALAEQSEFVWWVDRSKQLHFRDPAGVTGPSFADADLLGRPAVDGGNPDYRNRQYVRGGIDLTDEQTEQFTGDSETQAFLLSFPVAQVPTVTLNAGAQTVGIRGIEDGKDWYWNKGDNTISQDRAATPITGADTLEVTYVGQYPIVAMVEDPDAVNSRKAVEGAGSGYWESVLEDPTVKSREAAFDVGRGRIARFGVDRQTLQFDTRDTDVAPGQSIAITSDLLDLDGNFKVTEVVTTVDDDLTLRRAVTATDGPVDGSWELWWRDKLSRPSAIDLVNVGGGNVLALLTSISERWAWTENIEVVAIACTSLETAWDFAADGEMELC